MALPNRIPSLWSELAFPGARFCSSMIVGTSCFQVKGLGEVNKIHTLWRRLALFLRVFSEAFRISGNTSCDFCHGFLLRWNLVQRGDFKE